MKSSANRGSTKQASRENGKELKEADNNSRQACLHGWGEAPAEEGLG
jgi:hypothetical protein